MKQLRTTLSSRPWVGTRRRGFTLVEMLGVLALLGVLMAIAVPSYMAYRDRVKQRQAAVELLAMATTIQGFQTDNRDYPVSLASVKLADRKDPWGRAYVYYNVVANGRGGARKDRALNPLNTDFDLYSLGPDGKTKPQVSQKDSVDDVIRANNGGYFGLAGDF